MRSGNAGSETGSRRPGSSPSMTRNIMRGAPVAHACGLHAVGYSTGNLTLSRP